MKTKGSIISDLLRALAVERDAADTATLTTREATLALERVQRLKAELRDAKRRAADQGRQDADVPA